jgi:hypothetical protein
VCVDISLFSSYHCKGTGALLMGNRSHACVLSVGTIILKFTSGKDGAIEERATSPLYQKESY